MCGRLGRGRRCKTGGRKRRRGRSSRLLCDVPRLLLLLLRLLHRLLGLGPLLPQPLLPQPLLLPPQLLLPLPLQLRPLQLRLLLPRLLLGPLPLQSPV